jgi:Na+-translocating ferredoxin:NAD+ oxidoreductase subunit G
MSESAETAPRPALRSTLAYQAGLLGVVAAIAAALLTAGHLLTRDAIEARQLEALRNSLALVVPAEVHDNDLLGDSLSLPAPEGERLVYRARQGGQTSGVAFRVTGYGYSGAIRLLMGVAADGRLLGVRVLSHAETPGLGDKIEARRHDWILGFDGLSLGNPPEEEWGVKKDGGRFDQFTGATITPRAVVKAVKEGLQWFRDHRETLLATPGPEA